MHTGGRAAFAVALVVLAHVPAACRQPSIDDTDAQDVVDGLPGVVTATADCSNPIEGPSCTLAVEVTSDITVEQIAAIVEKSAPSLVDDVIGVSVRTEDLALTVNRGSLDDAAIGAAELVTMRGVDHVVAGEVNFRSPGERSVRVTTDELGAGLDIATALRTDELPDVTVVGDGLQLSAGLGLPAAEFAFAERLSGAVDGISQINVDIGRVVAYCSGQTVQDDVLETAPTLEGYADVETFDAYQDAP